MISDYAAPIFKCMVWTALTAMACSAYAYLVNARRPNDDPKKRDYHPLAILMAPITIPLFLGLAILVFMIRSLLFGTLIVAGTISLVAIRKPFLFVLLDKIAMKIGEPLLKLNTYLLKAAFG